MNLKNFLTIITVLIVIGIQVIFTISGYWLLGSLHLVVITGFLFMAKGKENLGIWIIVIGSTFLDIVAYRYVGLELLIFSVSCILFLLLSRSFAFFDTRSRNIKIILMFAVFVFTYNGFLLVTNSISFAQLVISTLINTLIVGLLILLTRDKKSHHVLRA